MPNAIVKSFAQKSGKSEADVEDYWNKAKGIVSKQYPEVKDGSEQFYKLLTGVLKNMLSIKTENDGADLGGIKYSDISPGTTAGLTTYHKKKRILKRTVSERFDKVPMMSMEEIGVFNTLLKGILFSKPSATIMATIAASVSGYLISSISIFISFGLANLCLFKKLVTSTFNFCTPSPLLPIIIPARDVLIIILRSFSLLSISTELI